MKYLFFSLILLAVLFEVAADILFKKWSVDNRSLLLAIGVLLYMIGTVAWAYSLKLEYLSKAVTVFTVLNFILVLLAGVFFFDEHLSVMNKIGIALGLASIVLVQL